eukprot:4034687-Lingulodinium_polyedra.AAC.1
METIKPAEKPKKEKGEGAEQGHKPPIVKIISRDQHRRLTNLGQKLEHITDQWNQRKLEDMD